MEEERALGKNVECRLQLEAVLEKCDSGKDIQAEPGSGHGDDQPANIAQVADVVGPHKGEEDEVILLALILVHSGNLVGHPYQRVVGTACITHILDQCFLPIISGEDGNLVSFVAHQPHVHVDMHDILSLCQVLIEERAGLAFSHPVEVGHIDQLVVEAETSIGSSVVGAVEDVRQVAEALVPPVVQAADGRP